MLLMQLYNLSIPLLVCVLFTLFALLTLMVGIKMPKTFDNDQKLRSLLKKRIYVSNRVEIEEDDQVN
jgi:hypothetical protein